MVVRGGRLVSADGVFWSIDVKSEVDASTCKLVHALGMILAVIDGVHADSIDSKLLEPERIDENG